MALYDNKYWLLSHIRNSFMSTDDTGMCELVMSGEAKDIKDHIKSTEPYPDPESSDDEEDEFESFDFQLDMDFNIRERSNTATQIEKLELIRKKAAKMRHIKWETNKGLNKDVDIDELFAKKDINVACKSEKPISKLSALIQKHADVPKNPFIEYAKFDGTGQVNIPTKKYKIFLTMLPPQQRNYPMPVCCVANAKVQDLIGLILLKFSYNYGTSNLKSVNHYGLYITEEDGEVDSDFPCLDSKEPISKFGFGCLGLVEHKESIKTVSFPDDTLFTIEGVGTRLTTISDKKADENKQMENVIQAVEDHNKLMEAPLYRSFRVYMLSKVKPKIEVNIGVSGERIEIDPVPQKGSKLLPFKAKAISHPIDSIACCEIIDDKNGRVTFRITYKTNTGSSFSGAADTSVSGVSSHSLSSNMTYKNYDFEGNTSTAMDLVQKINLILELKSSYIREEYLANKGKKLQKKKSFHIVK
ncbi:stress-activated map kinase-interacting protein 1 [Diorhabda carinulata]|uniref:stress-activated map kinase-interacting protein 1 n=1 Tax=Diorhabda carinulata TaxID=1163345 RepID=UPI0025A2D976|nr:stress-activated map kinase-interacting protein 1 [Diorhabda carinulata]